VFDQSDPGATLASMAELVTPMAIRVAATLRVADHIAGGRRTAPELAAAVDADPDALGRLLRFLADKEILDPDGSGGYVLTPLGDALRDGHPSGLRASVDIEGATGRADTAFIELLGSVRTGSPAFPSRFGRPFWDDLAADSGRSASYDAQMGADVARWARDVVPALDWGSLGHVVDVGGGDGTLLIAMLSAHPGLRGTLVELPRAAGAARTAFVEAGLGDRTEVVARSFFDPLPPGAGAYVLCAVLHDWNDGAARTILRRCADAAGGDGAVLVIEKTGPDGTTVNASMDLRVLAYFGGRERALPELTALAADAGLRVAAVHPAGRTPLIELRP
jgi:hypothetical protein